MNDLAFALRILRRSPAYTLLATATLALAIGVNGAVFGLLDSLYFRPVPLRDPERLFEIELDSPHTDLKLISYPEFRDIQHGVPAFEAVAAIGRRGVTLHRQGEARLLLIDYVSGNAFEALGFPLLLGRGLKPSDDSAAAAPAAVINHQLWADRLGGRPDIVGQAIQLNDAAFTVVGVTAPGFGGLSRNLRTDVWVAAQQAPVVVPALQQELQDRHHRWFQLLARPSSAVSMAQAQAQLDTLVERWRSNEPQRYRRIALAIRSLSQSHRQGVAEGAVFLALVGLVLLIACANVANLTLARSEARRRELAVRAALGAGRFRLQRQLLAECALLTLAAAALGLLLGAWLMELFPALLPPGAITYSLDLRLDRRLLIFTGMITIATTALVGLAPAWRASRRDILVELKSVPPPAAAGRGIGGRDLLVVVQIAIGLVVVIAAGLLLRSFAHGLEVNPGFDTRKSVVSFYLVPGLRGYDAEGSHGFFEECRRRVNALPAVERVSYAIRLPAQQNESGWASDFNVPGLEPPDGEAFFRIRYTIVGPDYFELMGTRILDGRGIHDRDQAGRRGVAVINRFMAERLWPGANPIGKTILMGRLQPQELEVVGVAENHKIADLYEPPEMYLYVSYAQQPQFFGVLLVEVRGEPRQVYGPVRSRIAEIDPTLPVLDVGSFAGHMQGVLYPQRRDASVALGISLIALLLSAVGIYGVIALVTARRTREIGIRMALGARRGDVLRLVLGKGLRLAGAGVLLGLAGGWAAARLLEHRLHGVESSDPWSYLAGSAILILVALLASWLPSWRAARVDPGLALRSE